jgi:hypothetical protein
MRSKLVACAAFTVVAIYGGLATTARAADPKGKASKKKSSELMDDQISRQMQWEDKVMGPDDKRAELDKIARAQAVNKAAAEKAEREKADREKAAAREAAAPKPQVKRNDVALPTLPDEGAKADKGKPHEISPKLETAAAAAPPPPVRPADDKFIDKLLKDEPAGKKKSARSSSDDKELQSLLAISKDKPAAKAKGRKGGGDTVDSLLEDADKAPNAPAPRVKHEVPEWAKPEIESTHTTIVSPIARPQPKKDDGIIHVVQGAAGQSSSPSRSETVASRVTPPPASSSRRGAPARASGGWNDPFSDGGSKKGAMAARDRGDFDAPPAASSRRSTAAAPAAPARSSRGGGSSGSWDDPFADPPSSKPARREPASAPAPAAAPRKAPAAPARWKDPFGDNEPSATPARNAVAMREPAKGEPNKWEVAARRPAPAATSDASHSRWSILKKRAH